ncbi:MAG: prepilin-type N-terminal cleavage/methylation domain-containing protein [Candidatus Roizmanbacteria bacterium]
MNNKNISSGFTLIELLIYMGILSIFLIILTDVFVSILGVKLESSSYSSVEQDGRYIMNRLSYDIHRATSITTPSSPGQSTSSLALVIGGINYTYNLNSNNLVLTSNSISNTLNSNLSRVNNIQFQRIGNVGGKNTIHVVFTVTSTIQPKSGPVQKNYEISSGIR